jgi:hypothetical protein
VNLPVGTKVQASFQYDNLDQFYIQVLSQKSFFETVSVPRMKEEGIQLSGNPGQGGEVATDSNVGASEGGIANDVYRQKDAQIETRVFKNIYDFFQGRLSAFGDEAYAALGYKLFNTDGTFSEDQQNAATMVVNRIFPFTDYTNNEPYKANPITGYFRGTGAYFSKNSTGVVGYNTLWYGNGVNGQLGVDGFIGRPNSTTRYKITQVVSDTSVSITPAFSESSTPPYNYYGETYVGSKPFPIYDDDGYIGPKIVGTKSSNFGLADFDQFVCAIDGVAKVSTFNEPPLLPFPPVTFLRVFFPLSGMSSEQVANKLMGDIPELKVTTETVIDPDQPFGYRTALVLRTDSTSNILTLVSGDAVSKLGFTIGATSTGNIYPTVYRPEVYVDELEIDKVKSERLLVNSIIQSGSANKLNRVSTYNLGLANNVQTLASQEMALIVEEVNKINDQTRALDIILQEPTLPSYATSLQAYGDATDMLVKDVYAYLNDYSLYSDWQGKLQGWAWVLDFDNTAQYIRGINTVTGVGTSTSTGANISPIDGSSTFILEVPATYDRRFLDGTIGVTPFAPVLLYENNSLVVPGTWSGWGVNSTTVWWRGVAYGNSLYVAVGDGGSIQTSADAITWTSQISGTANDLYAITWTGTMFTAVGQSGTVLSSLNGVLWTSAGGGVPVAADLYDVISVGSSLIAVGNGYILTSPDSMTWTARSTGLIWPSVLSGVTYNGAHYIAIGPLSAFFSYDSTTWISSTASIGSYAITSRGSDFITAGAGGLIRVSVNSGVTWTDQTSNTTENLLRVLWNSSASKLIAIGDNGTIISPVDATAWGAQYSNTFEKLSGLWAGPQYIASGDSGTILTSTDASSWSIRAPSTDGYSVNNQIVFTGDSTPLRACVAFYQTISDQQLDNRYDFDTTRIQDLTDRTDYLNLTRLSGIGSSIANEGLLYKTDGMPGDIYTWANARFNRRQGCNAKLNQINQQIASNQSALQVNQTLL